MAVSVNDIRIIDMQCEEKKKGNTISGPLKLLNEYIGAAISLTFFSFARICYIKTTNHLLI